MNGVILDEASFARDDLCLDGLLATLPRWRRHGRTDAAELPARLRQAEVVVVNKVCLDSGTLARLPALRLICVAATGTNNIDLQAAAARSIAVCNVRAYATPSVVQHVFALILALTTRLLPVQRRIGQGEWQRSEHFCLLDEPVSELSGKVLGIVGYGELGQAVASVARAFAMSVRVAARPGRQLAGRVPLDELLATADVVSLHCPLTDETAGMIAARELARMKPSAILINTARGGIVDEQALADALRAGRLAGAGIDVLSNEPPIDGNPLLTGDCPNLIVTPHVAWASRQARQRLVDEMAANIRAWLAGERRNRLV